MKTYQIELMGIAPMSHNKPVLVEKLPRETADAYEERTWGERLHQENGKVIIPAMALKNALSECAKFLSKQIPGKGKSTYTKHFDAGIMVTENLITNVAVDDVKSERVFVPADGVKGSGKRVWKVFPCIPTGWKCQTTIHVIDELITQEVLAEHLKAAGLFIGFGRFRPRNGGLYGRFNLTSIKEVK